MSTIPHEPFAPQMPRVGRIEFGPGIPDKGIQTTGYLQVAPTDKGIGDVNSTAKGSGARFNTGKPDYSLIPIKLYLKQFGAQLPPTSTWAYDALGSLGGYQQDWSRQDFLWDVIHVLGADGWAECANVFAYGKAKYAPWNWAKGMAWSIPVACAVRHLVALINGEINDPESGLSHRGHVFCNIVMLLTFAENYLEGNDLPPPGLLP